MVKNGTHLRLEKNILWFLSPMGNHKLGVDKLQVLKMSGSIAIPYKIGNLIGIVFTLSICCF